MTGEIPKKEQVLESYRKKINTSDSIQHSEVKQVIKYIHENLFHSRLTISRLKKKCQINGGSFAARFKNCVGVYPKAYILNHRLEAGKQLLKRTEVSVTTIAIMVGFNSLSAFCKVFKRKEGQSPSVWRNNSAAKQ